MQQVSANTFGNLRVHRSSREIVDREGYVNERNGKCTGKNEGWQ